MWNPVLFASVWRFEQTVRAPLNRWAPRDVASPQQRRSGAVLRTGRCSQRSPRSSPSAMTTVCRQDDTTAQIGKTDYFLKHVWSSDHTAISYIFLNILSLWFFKTAREVLNSYGNRQRAAEFINKPSYYFSKLFSKMSFRVCVFRITFSCNVPVYSMHFLYC